MLYQLCSVLPAANRNVLSFQDSSVERVHEARNAAFAGRGSTPRTSVKIAAFAPMPNASVTITVTVSPLVRARERTARLSLDPKHETGPLGFKTPIRRDTAVIFGQIFGGTEEARLAAHRDAS